jgi:small subunit ribosomal protein S21
LPKVELRSGESQQNLVRRFRKAVSRSSLLGEVRRKRWFTPNSEQRRIAKKKAIRRLRRKTNKRPPRG